VKNLPNVITATRTIVIN